MLSSEKRVRFERLQAWVCMGHADRTADAARKLGIVGESELRERLCDFRVAGASASSESQLKGDTLSHIPVPVSEINSTQTPETATAHRQLDMAAAAWSVASECVPLAASNSE